MSRPTKPLPPLVLEDAPGEVSVPSRRRDRARRNHHKGTVTLKPFVSWDGEAAGTGRDAMQDYCLIGNSDGGELLTRTGHLHTLDLLEFMLNESERLGDCINVAFGFNYDVNHILRHVPFKLLQRLYKDNSTFYSSYRLEWYPSKWFAISDRGSSRYLCIYDTIGYWSTSLLGALALDPELRDHPDLAIIQAGKLDRGTFTHDELDDKVIPYFQTEMRLHAQLMENLRASLLEVDLVPRKWYGPSAIISEVYTRSKLKGHMDRPVSDETRERRKRHGRLQRPDRNHSYNLPDAVNVAGRAAFAGGRFEQFKIGLYEGPVYGYDITSAYPYAMLSLPSLHNGRWKRVESDSLRTWRRERLDHLPFGFYRIAYNHLLRGLKGTLPVYPWSYPHPLFRRDEYGRISYPYAVQGWYPAHSANAVWRRPEARFIEAWILEPGDSTMPFHDESVVDFQAMFEQRQSYRNEGREDLAYALKITLNSGYGKTAQRKGVGPGDNLPAFHQIEWAGHITDHCRASIWQLALLAWNRGGLISIETDAVYSTVPLDCESPGLGGLKAERYEGICYLQSGVYFTLQEGHWTFHCRGLDSSSLSLDGVRAHLDSITELDQPWPSVYGRTHSFNGIGYARINDGGLEIFYGKWLRWNDADREIRLGVPGLKRVHHASKCGACAEGLSPAKALHDLSSPAYHEGPSYARHDAWIPGSAGVVWQDQEEDDRWN